jgi:hypothetical protein
MSGLFNLLATIFGWLTGKKAKDPITEVYQHDQTIAEKQASDLADRTKPSTVDSLSRGDF